MHILGVSVMYIKPCMIENIKVLRSSAEEHHGDNEKVGSSNLPEATMQ
ncbi:hypothetical protein KL86DYS1_10416 [uncultured Dysgonomonas sp.]|uniref:Uncharacterized protein n=1 Tax=uncultured Dysgonomonas sp. TaxID=206096 RepID=A0A212IWW5_9BACT|nr:hypothetical protein KL86DYS1_10416 [uncultured Dysgonomonas sp.]